MLERLDFWIAVVVLCALAYAEVRPLRRAVRFFVKRLTGLFVVMSPDAVGGGDQHAAESTPFAPRSETIAAVKDSAGMREIGYQEGEAIGFTFLARLVRDGKLTETEALTIGCQVKPGKSAAYRAARDKLHQAMSQIGTQYAPYPPQFQAANGVDE